MNSRITIQRFVAGSLFITINALFYFKYLYRVSLPMGLVVTGGYIAFIYLLFSLYKRQKLGFPVWVWAGVMGLLTIGSGLILHFIPKESLNVDRWEMIQLFWDSVSDGIYPYGVHSPEGNYPGPMPFYFIVAYPFYKVGEIGWMTVGSLWLTLWYFQKRIDRNSLGFLMLLLLSSLAIYWEIFARSTIFINSLLFALYLFGLKDLPKRSGLGFYGWAFIGGILFSMRTVFVLPLIIWGMYVCLRKEIRMIRIFKWGLCFIAAFALTFLPFYCMSPHTFMRLNPFVTQGDVLLPFSYVVCFLGLAFVVPFFCRKYADVCFYGGVLLFATISGHVVYGLYDNGIESFLTNGADISYYLFCFPFLLETIVNKDEE
ncbi:hypothetical protein [uncultured Parabacteroides sp.]|uniref:hypothetical protein n=1 Tax=uncultured Parabacteroides sp. TaxID=512312 RepID=UPI0026325DC1|nr:hypothetical protein [uncultured Parabacteroides sp.]